DPTRVPEPRIKPPSMTKGATAVIVSPFSSSLPCAPDCLGFVNLMLPPGFLSPKLRNGTEMTETEPATFFLSKTPPGLLLKMAFRPQPIHDESRMVNVPVKPTPNPELWKAVLSLSGKAIPPVRL